MALNATQRLRMSIVTLLVVVAFAATIVRLYQIQCLDHEKYSNYARRQHTTRITIPVRRGTITDVRGNQLAISLPVQSLYADPAVIQNKSIVAWEIAPVLDMDHYDIFTRLLRGSRFSWIKRKLSPDEHQELAEMRIRGLGFRREYVRVYPQGRMLGQVLGFVGIDDNGLAGLELTLERALAGEPGYRVAKKDASGNVMMLSNLEVVPGTDGLDIVLTIDSTIQRIVEEEVEKIAKQWRPEKIAAVAMDPATGEILALGNWPFFDPNTLGSLSPAELRRLNQNGAVLDVYEPGSTFKVFTMAGALEEGLLHPLTVIDAEKGHAVVNGRRIRDTSAHGKITANEVMIKSSNIAMAKIGVDMGNERLHACLRSFGFGSRTGLPVRGESAGLLAPVSQWTRYSVTSIPMGQEIAVTPVQLVNGYCTIASGGMHRRPTLVKRIVNSGTGEVLGESSTEPVRRVVSEETARAVTEMLVGAVEHPKGTGRRARIEGYHVAGKTGTAQKSLPGQRGYSGTDYISSFIAYAPAYQPRIVVLVAVDTPRGHSHFGGTVAAPAVREIIRRSLAYMEVPPELDPVAKPSDAIVRRDERNGGEL